jgi:hypothetical protein
MSYLDLASGVALETRTSFKIIRCSRFAPQVGAARALVFQSGANQGAPLLDARVTSAAKSLARRRFLRSARARFAVGMFDANESWTCSRRRSDQRG